MNKVTAIIMSPTFQRLAGPVYKQMKLGTRRGLDRQLHGKFPDYDEEVIETIRRVDRATMTSPQCVAALCQAVRYVVRARIPGAIAECGVWRGGSMMAVALTLQRLGVTRDLYLYDTFDGMTAPEHVDKTSSGGRLAADRLGPSTLRLLEVPLETVAANMASTGYDDALVHYVPGPVEETLPAAAPDRIALLRLDTDWYKSTRHELETLFPRLSPGGILIIDDYGDWQGAKLAVDEYFAASPVFLNRIDYTARLVVKSSAVPEAQPSPVGAGDRHG
jgi:O-methyltransferase